MKKRKETTSELRAKQLYVELVGCQAGPADIRIILQYFQVEREDAKHEET